MGYSVDALASAHPRRVGGPGRKPALKGCASRMDKVIGIVDLSSGAVTDCQVDCLTLDVPPDIDQTAGSVSLSADNVARYVTASGLKRSYLAHPTALARRARGEECLVAADTGIATSSRSYRIAMVDLDD
jgi:hypothetical protein